MATALAWPLEAAALGVSTLTLATMLSAATGVLTLVTLTPGTALAMLALSSTVSTPMTAFAAAKLGPSVVVTVSAVPAPGIRLTLLAGTPKLVATAAAKLARLGALSPETAVERANVVVTLMPATVTVAGVPVDAASALCTVVRVVATPGAVSSPLTGVDAKATCTTDVIGGGNGAGGVAGAAGGLGGGARVVATAAGAASATLCTPGTDTTAALTALVSAVATAAAEARVIMPCTAVKDGTTDAGDADVMPETPATPAADSRAGTSLSVAVLVSAVANANAAPAVDAADGSMLTATVVLLPLLVAPETVTAEMGTPSAAASAAGSACCAAGAPALETPASETLALTPMPDSVTVVVAPSCCCRLAPMACTVAVDSADSVIGVCSTTETVAASGGGGGGCGGGPGGGDGGVGPFTV